MNEVLRLSSLLSFICERPDNGRGKEGINTSIKKKETATQTESQADTANGFGITFHRTNADSADA